MSRKSISGECKICGNNKKLTFEHVPPETTFNNKTVKMVTGDVLINAVSSNDRLPWESKELKGRILQRGRGGHYLCEECNSKTGSWYVPYYSEFIHGFHGVLQQIQEKSYDSLYVKTKDIRPLAIFKQIMVMFCDINHGCMGDDSLREFLLNKEAMEFNRKKYRIFAYIHDGELERLNGISCMFVSGIGSIIISEIATYPLGFALYIDLPENYKPQGVELTLFSNYDYEDKCDAEITIPKLECNIIFSGDYRTKEEILTCMEESKQWEEEHAEEIKQF